MNRRRVITGALAAFAIVFASAAIAGTMGGGGWGPGSKYGRLYDPKNIVTVSGEVEKIEKTRPIKGMSYGIHLVIKGGDPCTYTSVHLGPAWYINQQEIKLSVGDKVEIKGSQVEIDGKPAVIAAEVTKGDDVLVLRDENGVPLWSGWRRKR